MRTSHRPHFVWELSALDNMRSSICPGPFSILIVNYKPLAAYFDLSGSALVHDRNYGLPQKERGLTEFDFYYHHIFRKSHF
jgi:hypothetical protein